MKKKLEASTGDKILDEKVFKCDQCGNIFKSENGLKIHVGKSHKAVNPATPDCLRQQPASREEVGEEKEEEEECNLSTTSKEDTCRNCNDPFRRLSEYFYLCCQDDKKLCHDCCSDLEVCDKMYDPVTDSWVKKVASKM